MFVFFSANVLDWRKPCANHRAGFSLIEIMIMVLLLAALATLLLPVLESSRNTAKYAVCTMNLKQIYNGIMTEATARDESMMDDPYQWEVYAEALVETEVMICPMETEENIKLNPEVFKFLNEPPKSMMEGEEESDTQVIVFREQAALKLPQGVSVLSESGRYGNGYNGGGTCEFTTTDSSISAGTIVDVYYFSFDPATNNNHGNAGEIIFGGYDDLVLGMIADTADLNATDSLVGAPGTVYPKMDCRGLSPCHFSSDSIEIAEDRRSIIHNFSKALGNCKDDFRVFTTPGSGSSYAMNVEIKETPRKDYQFMIADAEVPWIDFEGGVDDGEFSYEQTFKPRHFGKINMLLMDGSVELFGIEDLNPENYLWRN